MNKLFTIGAAAAVTLAASNLATAQQTVAHWTFGANGLTDITGNNAITLENHGVTFTNGAALFDGSSYLVTTAPVTLGATTKSFTIECWVRFDANNNFGYIFAPSDASEKGAFVVYQQNSKFYGQFRVAPSTWQQEVQDLTGSTAYPHHIAYVVDASKSGADQAKLYLDGTPIPNSSLKTSGDFSTGFGSRKLYIGAHGNNGSPDNGFKGLIDDIRITDGALEPSQFLKFPTVGDAMTPANPAFAYYPFGASGPSDVSGNGNDLAWPTTQSSSPSYLDGTLSLNGSCNIGSTSKFPFSQFTKSGLTFECFFRTTSTADDARILLETSGNYTGNIGAFHLSLRDNCTTLLSGLRTEDGYNVDKSTGTPAANDGRWRHVAMVYDPAKTGEDLLVTYLDGVKLPVNGTDTKSTLSLLCDASFFVGARANYILWATAEFDDVRIMPYALSPSEFLKAPSVNAPVAHWKFDSETPLVDVTGNGNDLVNSNVTFAGGAAVFNGSGATLKTASTLDLSAYRRATIECRYQMNSLDKFGVLFALENTAGNTPGSFVVYKNGKAIYSQFGTTTSWQQDGITGLTSSSPYASAGWHHIAYVVDVTQANEKESILYIDGVKQNQSMNNTATLSALLNQKLCIGGGSSYGSNQATTFDGKISEIIVTPLALAPGAFKLTREPPVANIIAYWDFSGSGWSDKSGNGHALTATGLSKKNGAAQFASGATLATTAALDLSGCRSVTVECFAKANSAAADMALFSFGNGTYAGSFSASIAATGGAASRYVPYADALNSDATALGGTDGDWHHYALVIDADATGADQARLYVDGVQAASGALASGASLPALSATFGIGTGFTGLIDDVRITADALAPAQFMQAPDRTEVPDAFVITVR
ncbi:MAG: laminin G domain-containing protein [Kiritimatiellae bacterium]|nr:laminin G domain-containing protein [Kiritimatiellia bacterium]